MMKKIGRSGALDCLGGRGGRGGEGNICGGS